MTVGNPLPTLLFFAIPLFIGNIFQHFYNIVDTMIAGRFLGEQAIAAIGSTSSLMSLLINLTWGLCSGYSIIISRSFGSGNIPRLKKAIALTVVLNVTITVLVAALALVFLNSLLRLLSVPKPIYADSYAYISIILSGLVMTMLYNMVSAILRAVGNSRTPLYFLIFSSALNAGLDVLFIAVLHKGIRGAAAATVLAQAISALLSGCYLLKNYRGILPSRGDFRPEGKLLGELLSTGIAMGLMYCVVDIGSVLYQRAINALGETLIVAHTAARRLIILLMSPLSSLANACSTFVSQNVGARRFDRIRSGMKITAALEMLWSAFSCALVFAFGAASIKLLTSTDDAYIIDNAVLSLRLHVCFYPSLSILFLIRNSMQAVGMRIFPVISSALELLIKVIAGFRLIPRYGFIWACLAEPVTWVVCMLFLITVFVITKPVKGP